VPEIGRSLRRERTRQGLRIEDVSARTGIDSLQLEGLEAGTVDRLPDRVQTLKVLRSYANSLGLSGDRYVLVLVEHWPASASATPIVRVLAKDPPRPDDTGVISAVVAAPEPAVAPIATRSLPPLPPVTYVSSSAAVGPEPATAQTPRIERTGPLPVVPGWHDPPPPRSSRSLRVVVGLVVIALVAGVAGIIVNSLEPHWLRDLGITRSSGTSKESAPPPTAPGGRTGTTGPSSRTSPTARSGRPARAAAPIFQQIDAQAQSATFEVHASSFVLSLLAVGGPSWMQIGVPGADPLFSGIVPDGGHETFPVHGSLVVQVGASSARALVAVQNKLVGAYVPGAAPFTMTFQSTG
jgi:transcriptional regulator with XRE-family HTH domain